MKIQIINFEGTTEEYNRVAPSLGKTTNETSENKRLSTTPKDAYRALLTRARVHAGQREMYKVLSKGEVPWSEYNKLMKRTEKQIRGVHGAFGRRINQTPEIHQANLPGNLTAVVVWNTTKKTIALKPEFLEVLEEEGLI
jgi:hypothetical protein